MLVENLTDSFGKHGIDLEAMQELWIDVRLLETPAISIDEPRLLVIGMIEKKHCTAVVTYHAEMIRIISARRSRVEEVMLYEGCRF